MHHRLTVSLTPSHLTVLHAAQVPFLDVGTEAGSSSLTAYLREEHGRVDYVVSAIGAWWRGGALQACLRA